MIPKTILMMMMAALFLGWACQSEQESSIEGTPVSFPPSLREETPAASVVRVSLNEEQMRHLNIRTVAVTPQIIRLPLEMPGTVEPSPERIAVISAPIEGMVVNILAHEGDRVRAGETLLEIESLEFANLLATYLQAKSTVAFQRSELERVRQLVDKKIAPLRNLEQVTSETERAETALRAAVARLLAVGVTEGQIQAFAANP
ncbi:MAG TPA: efflux RND transporter periplasmic adaptor subunit, partial [Calditrichia bacterium]|nr:efflux RND transporter periplasmic adaptor subunit [Calditrichia bacterium]